MNYKIEVLFFFLLSSFSSLRLGHYVTAWPLSGWHIIASWKLNPSWLPTSFWGEGEYLSPFSLLVDFSWSLFPSLFMVFCGIVLWCSWYFRNCVYTVPRWWIIECGILLLWEHVLEDVQVGFVSWEEIKLKRASLKGIIDSLCQWHLTWQIWKVLPRAGIADECSSFFTDVTYEESQTMIFGGGAPWGNPVSAVTVKFLDLMVSSHMHVALRGLNQPHPCRTPLSGWQIALLQSHLHTFFSLSC